MTRIAEKSPVFGLFCQNIVCDPPFNFEPPVLSRKGPGNRKNVMSITFKIKIIFVFAINF